MNKDIWPWVVFFFETVSVLLTSLYLDLMFGWLAGTLWIIGYFFANIMFERYDDGE